MPFRKSLSRLLAALTGTAAVALCAGAAGAAEPRDPIVIELPTGQGITIGLDPITVTGQTGAKDTPAGQVPGFGLDLLIFHCDYAVAADGTISCGLGPKPKPTPTAPTPTPGPTATPGPEPSAGPSAAPTGAATTDAGEGEARPDSSPTAGASEGPGRPPAGEDVDPDGPVAAGPEADDVPAAPSGSGPPPAAPLSTEALLDLGVSAFALLALVGSAGVAASSAKTWRRRYPATEEESQGSVLVADDGTYAFDPELAGPGDRSRWWRLVTGWLMLDRLSRLVPTGLAQRAPLTARIAADGSYLRAVLGVAWLVLPVAAFVLGLLAASDSDGYPLAPSLVLTAALICLAVLDATAGFIGVLGFLLGVLVWGPGDLGFAPSLRSFLGLAALWFAIPLIASAARPLRRTRERSALYTWDRLGDGLIAALISGWAVQGAVSGLPGLSGRQSPIDPYADRLALIAIAAVAVRVALEEVAARLFPERLKVVDTGMLPEPSPARSVVSALVRTAVFVFVAYPFIGNCWQLWVGAAMFALPQLLGVVADRFPNSERVFQVLPRGVALVLFMILVGIGFAHVVDSVVSDDPEVVQNAFVLLALPGLVLSIVSLLGREGPSPERSWRYELLGAAAVGLSVALVLNG